MIYLYVLKLEHDKWYIGKTNNVESRYEQHVNGNGSAWTRLHKPIELYLSRYTINAHDENNTTKDYMKEYGIDNVRGGAYTFIELTEDQIDCLSKEIRDISNCCYTCGKPDHFEKDCSEIEIVEYMCEKCDTIFETEQDCEKHENKCVKSHCTRCGRISHIVQFCYARTHTEGYLLF